ncbi:hypothetical protein HPB51_012007 [Rhipicephalus microplus]|uniref:Uncharacterized protein n=1 Tax=Rhipicephalus microplus TaxID=6941 RepID=A0A9J6F2J0_RHIMP|nr:hypothetical protein HPB51_012007 [Rhipicephalus microplus]
MRTLAKEGRHLPPTLEEPPPSPAADEPAPSVPPRSVKARSPFSRLTLHATDAGAALFRHKSPSKSPTRSLMSPPPKGKQQQQQSQTAQHRSRQPTQVEKAAAAVVASRGTATAAKQQGRPPFGRVVRPRATLPAQASQHVGLRGTATTGPGPRVLLVATPPVSVGFTDSNEDLLSSRPASVIYQSLLKEAFVPLFKTLNSCGSNHVLGWHFAARLLAPLPKGSLLRRHSVEPERRRGSVQQQRSLDSLDHHTALIHRHHHAATFCEDVADTFHIVWAGRSSPSIRNPTREDWEAALLSCRDLKVLNGLVQRTRVNLLATGALGEPSCARRLQRRRAHL